MQSEIAKRKPSSCRPEQNVSLCGDIVDGGQWLPVSIIPLREDMVTFNRFGYLSILKVTAVQGLCFGERVELAVRAGRRAGPRIFVLRRSSTVARHCSAVRCRLPCCRVRRTVQGHGTSIDLSSGTAERVAKITTKTASRSPSAFAHLECRPCGRPSLTSPYRCSRPFKTGDVILAHSASINAFVAVQDRPAFFFNGHRRQDLSVEKVAWRPRILTKEREHHD
jgi:hypothetical protein